MWESALLDVLRADGELSNYVSTYTGDAISHPAIFANVAPEDKTEPYITFKITTYPSQHIGIDIFNVYIDYFDTGESRSDSRKAAERIEFILDEKILTHERYDSIRISRESAGDVEEDDPREIHYNSQFSARAGRKKWMQQL